MNNRQKKSLILGLIITVIFSLSLWATPSWNNVGPVNFAEDNAGQHQFVVHTDGTPYVAYRKVISGPYGASFYLMVKSYDVFTNTWNELGDYTTFNSTGTQMDIAVSPAGICYVAYGDGDNQGKITVMKYENNTWVAVGSAGFSTDYLTENPVLEIAKNGTPYVAYVEGTTSLKDAVTVKKFNGTDWETVGTTLGGFGIGQNNLTFAIDNNNVPYVTLTEQNVSMALGIFTKTYVLKYTGSNWDYIPYGLYGNSITPYAGAHDETLVYPSLAFDQNNNIYVAYIDSVDPYAVQVKTNDGTSWVQVGSPIKNIQYDLDVYQAAPSLVVSASGHPYVTFKARVTCNHSHCAPLHKDLVMTFNKWTDTDWRILGYTEGYMGYVEGFEDGGAALSKLGTDLSGNIYVSYLTDSTHVKKFQQY